MRAMILAAGRGERMGDLTSQTPKPLLRVNDDYLIEHVLYRLKKAGITDIVINISYLGYQIKNIVGDGKKYGVNIIYSEEAERLETGGGIFKALSLLGEKPFIVVSSDVITDYPFEKLPQSLKGLSHLVMVDNPAYHTEGDFGLHEGYLDLTIKPFLTYANIGVLHPDLFHGCAPGYFRLSDLLRPAIEQKKITGEHYRGVWYNIGTPADLEIVKQRAREDSNLRPLASETNTLSN